jgi:hypothetical protein
MINPWAGFVLVGGRRDNVFLFDMGMLEEIAT